MTLVLLPNGTATQHASAAPVPQTALIEAYFRAKKPEDRANALAAIVATPAPDAKQVTEAREQILEHLAKRGRKLSGRDLAAQREPKLATLSFHVDERLLDVGREIVIVVDGKERGRTVPVASLGTLLPSAEEREDPEYASAYEVRLP